MKTFCCVLVALLFSASAFAEISATGVESKSTGDSLTSSEFNTVRERVDELITESNTWNGVEGIPINESGTPSAADVADIANLLQSTCVMEDYAFDRYFSFNFDWDDVDGRYEYTSTGNGGYGFRNDEDGLQVLVPTAAGTEDAEVTYHNFEFNRDGTFTIDGSAAGQAGPIAIFSNGIQSSNQVDSGSDGVSLDEISETDIEAAEVNYEGAIFAIGPNANGDLTWWRWGTALTSAESEHFVYPNDTDGTGCWNLMALAGIGINNLGVTSERSQPLSTGAYDDEDFTVGSTIYRSVVRLTGDDDGDHDSIDLQDGTADGQEVTFLGVATIDSSDNITIDVASDSTCTGCSGSGTFTMDDPGDKVTYYWNDAVSSWFEMGTYEVD